MKVVVAPVSEFPVGERRLVRAGRREIGVFRTREGFFAIKNRCPHQGAPLCEGKVLSRIVSEQPGSIAVAEAPPLIACPWHGWQYDALTGEAYAPGDPRVRSYGVETESGAALDRERACGKATLAAETFEVTVDDDYVVVEA